VAHLAATMKEAMDPTPIGPDDPPPPQNRERLHDQRVNRRRAWSVKEVLEEYHTYLTRNAGMPAHLQEEPLASTPMHLPGLGTYPMHALVNAAVFDNYCHLRIDILAPSGPVVRALRPATQEMLYPAVQWMMWGLPQMQGHELADSWVAPLTISLNGPGESTWTVKRDERGDLAVTESGGGDVTIVSSAHDFVSWGTKRSSWREHSELIGQESLAAGFLDVLNII
jgi:hypothetical protein